jgi:hypothetical protein
MVKIPKYDKKDWDQICEYVGIIGKFDRPDDSTEAIFTIPLAIALLASLEKAEKFNKILIGLTIVLALLTLILILKDAGYILHS